MNFRPTVVLRSKLIISAYQDWIVKGISVLDIGCGNCIIAAEIGKYFACKITATDIRDYRERDFPFRLMQTQRSLPFEDKSFSLAMFNNVLHHCKDKKAIFQEALRVADKVLIFEPAAGKIAEIIDQSISRIEITQHSKLEQAEFMNLDQWHDFLKGYNYDFRKGNFRWWYPLQHYAFRILN